MEENKNSDFKIRNNTVENNSNPRLGLSNFRPGSSNSNPRPGPSNSNSRPGQCNSNPRPSSSSNHWLERDRDRKIPKKRSHSDNDEWSRDNKLNKRETPDKVKKQGNSENKRLNENPNDIPFMSLKDMALASQRMAVATMSQQSQQQMAVAMPQQSQAQIMPQQAIPYPSYGYNASENYHMDPNQLAYTVNPFSPMLPINSQWPSNSAMPATASNVASTSGMGIANGMEMVAPANVGMNGYSYMSMGNSDGSLYGMVPIMPSISNFTQFPVMNNMDPVVPMFNNLEPITITRAVLTPPLSGERQSRRQKPPGCRTVFVGNLPEKITEEIIKDAFKICGLISVVRMNKKNYCHIRFVNMESVDQALLLSGFRIRIDESVDPAYNGKLHVDYATAYDDQHDYECVERARLREERHRQKEAFRPPSPPPIPHFSEHEAQILAERLRNEETFREGLKVLITWLERGECNKRNSGTFYSLIQSSHSHVKRLRNEKNRHEEEVEKAKETLINKNHAIEHEINEIEKVFVAAKTQKVWDHFTKGQRKKMEEMKNDSIDLKKTNSRDLLDNRKDEDMELSDNEDRNDNEENVGMLQLVPAGELHMLRERINSLTEELDTAHQTIEEFKDRCAEHQDEIVKLRLVLKENKKVDKDLPVNFDHQLRFNDCATQCSLGTMDATENDSKLISLVSNFLQVHPFGVSIDYICSYLVKIIPTINARDVESLLRRFPHVFREVCTGIGATLEKKWKYIGFGDQN